VAAAEEAAALRAAIDRIGGDHGQVLRLVHVEGLTLVAAAERMGRSAGAVEKLYGRALARLSERIRGRADSFE
jgi:DNA-directed RNA polymerase specialized sigma24 family protein